MDEKEDQDEAEARPDTSGLSKDQADAIYKVILDLKEAGYLAKRQLTFEL